MGKKSKPAEVNKFTKSNLFIKFITSWLHKLHLLIIKLQSFPKYISLTCLFSKFVEAIVDKEHSTVDKISVCLTSVDQRKYDSCSRFLVLWVIVILLLMNNYDRLKCQKNDQNHVVL